MNRFKLYFRMSRPKQLVSILMVFAWGTLLALAKGFSFSWVSFTVSIAAALFISVSIHFANEFADVETDRITRRTPFSGGSGALPNSDVDPSIAINGAFFTAVMGSLIAIFGVFNQMMPVYSLLILGMALFLGWGYSLKPLALAWRGWGEADNAFLGGVLLPIYGYFVFSSQVDFFILKAVIPFGLLAFVNLLATTWADKWADGQVGKFTLATQYPTKNLRGLYGAVIVIAYLAVIWLAPYPPSVIWTSLIAVPFSIWGFLRYTRQDDPTPSVFAMIAFLMMQLVTWATVVF